MQIKDTFFNCLDFCEVYGRQPYFYLTGGDPILHPSFWNLLSLFSEYQIPFTIMGNPFHLNDLVCRELKAFGCETGVDVFAISRYVPSGGDMDAGMTPKEYRSLLSVCDQKFKEYSKQGCHTFFNKKNHLWTLYEYETGEFKPHENAKSNMIYGGCNCGNGHLTILPTGEIYACRRVSDSLVGNVFTDRLADVWVTKMEKYRCYDQFSKCSRCKLLAYCRGCPAVAKGVNKDFYAEDPQCWASEENGLLSPAVAK